MAHGWLEVPTPGFAAVFQSGLCIAATREPQSQAHAHTTTSEPQLGSWPRRRSCWPLADPSPAQSAPAPRALALCACSSRPPTSLVSSDLREKFKETQLRPSWSTSALNQGIKMHILLPSSLFTLPNGPLQSLTKGLSPDVCQSFPEISQALLWLSFYAQKLTQIICQSTLPIFNRSPLKLSVLKACQDTCQGLSCQFS